MSFVSFTLGLSLAVLGIVAIGWPDSFAAILRELRSPAGLYFGAGVRLALGVSLFLSAAGSRAPQVLRVLGGLFLVAGLVMPLLGLEVFRSGLDSFSSLGAWAAPAWGVLALGLGLFVAYAVAPGPLGAGPPNPSEDP